MLQETGTNFLANPLYTIIPQMDMFFLSQIQSNISTKFEDEGWASENWCFWTAVLEKTLESSMDSKESKPVNPKGNQSWIFIGRTDDAETETPVFWPPDAQSQLIGKDSDAGKDWGQEEKKMTEDKIVGWHHRFNGHEFEQTPGYSEGQSLGLQNWTQHNNWTAASFRMYFFTCEVCLSQIHS